MLKNQILIFVAFFFILSSISFANTKNSLVFIYNSSLDEQVVLDDHGYAPALWKCALDDADYLRILEKYAEDEPIAVGLYPIVLDFLVSLDKDPYIKIFKKDLDHITDKDKEFILTKCVTLPTNYSWDDFPEYKELVDRIDFEVSISTEVLDGFSEQQLLDLSVWFHIVWSSDKVFEFNFVQSLVKKGENFSKKDLEKLLYVRDNELKRAHKFFKNLPLFWELLVYPYYDMHFMLTYRDNLEELKKDEELKINNFAYKQDLNWLFIKSLKSFDSFFEFYPQGFMVDIATLDKTVFSSVWIDGIDMLVNKSSKDNITNNLLVQLDNKEMYVIGNNVFLDDLDGFFDDSEIFISNFLTNIVEKKEATFLWEKVSGKLFSKNKELLKELIRKVVANIEIRNVTSFKSLLKDETSSFIKLDKLDFVEFKKSLKKSFNIELWIKWNEIRQKIEEYQNTGHAKIKILEDIYSKIYRLESSYWFGVDGQKDMEKLYIREFLSLTAKIQETIDMENKYMKDKRISLKKQTHETKQVEEYSIVKKYSNSSGFSITDSWYDDYGNGDYLYPKNELYTKGLFDIRRCVVYKKSEELIFQIFMRRLEDPEFMTNGFSYLQLDIYIDMNKRSGLGYNRLLAGRNAYTKLDNAWEFCVAVNGEEAKLYQVDIDDKIMDVINLNTEVDLKKRTITVHVPREIVKGDPSLWNYLIISCGYDPDNQDGIRYVREEADIDHFGGRKHDNSPNIIDVILPKGLTQQNVYNSGRKGVVEFPFINIENNNYEEEEESVVETGQRPVSEGL